MQIETKSITDETPISFLTVGQLKKILGVSAPREVLREEIPEIFGIDTAVDLSGYKRSTIYAKTSRNEIPHFKRDNKVLFRKSEFFAWLTENRIETKAEYSRRMDRKLSKMEK